MSIANARQPHVFGSLLIAIGEQMILHNQTAYAVNGGTFDHAINSPHSLALIKSMMGNGCTQEEAKRALELKLEYILD
jgi:hypothetical protein